MRGLKSSIPNWDIDSRSRLFEIGWSAGPSNLNQEQKSSLNLIFVFSVPHGVDHFSPSHEFSSAKVINTLVQHGSSNLVELAEEILSSGATDLVLFPDTNWMMIARYKLTFVLGDVGVESPFSTDLA